MFVQMLCGTEPHPKDFKAKKYKLDKHALSKEDFVHIMKNLPVTFIVIIHLDDLVLQVPVEDEDIEEMFAFADKNCDGKLSYSEFEVTMTRTMINK